MATQEEVLNAFRELGGYARVKTLKRYFELPYKPNEGSSWIPQRLNALLKCKAIFRTGLNVYILNDFENCTDEEAEQILNKWECDNELR